MQAARKPDGKDVRLGDHDLFGWRVRSALPLAGLRPWTGAARAPDLTISLGHARPPAGARVFSPALTIGRDRSVFVAVPGLGRFAVPDEATVVIDRAEGVRDSALQGFLLTEVLPIVCLLRGLVPLRASAVAIDGETVVLAGMPGMGKSTLAAHLLARGGRLIGDGFCALRHGPESGPELWPGVGAVQLWSDATAPLGLTSWRPSSAPGGGRIAVPVTAGAMQPTPVRPGRIALMTIDNDAEGTTGAPLPPGHAMRPRTLVAGWRLAAALGCDAWVFEALTDMLAGTACLQLRRGAAPFDLAVMARLLRETT